MPLRRLVLALGGAAGLLLAGLGAGYAFQRALIYVPDHPAVAPGVKGVPIEVVRLTTRDGERLTAWYSAPSPGKPVMLFLNGRIGGLAVQKGRWRRINKAGVGFLAVNYRGYADSTGRPTEAGLQEDARAAYAWLAERYPPQRIVIHGFSLGSGVAVRLAADHPARALILEAPFTALDDVAVAHAPLLPARFLLFDHYRSKDWIGRVDMPVLVIHGDADTIVPFASGQGLYALAKPPKQFVRMPGGDHNTLTRDGAYDRIWAFLGVDAT